MNDKAIPVQQPPSHARGAVWPERTSKPRIPLVEKAGAGSALGAIGFQLFDISVARARPVDHCVAAVARTPPIKARLPEPAPVEAEPEENGWGSQVVPPWGGARLGTGSS